MVTNLLKLLRPSSIPHLVSDVEKAKYFILKLQEITSETHMRVASRILNDSEYGIEYFRNAEKSRRWKTTKPKACGIQIGNLLNFGDEDLQGLWVHIRMVTTDAAWSASGDSNNQLLEHFAATSIEIVKRMCELWIDKKDELSSHSQITILKELSNPRNQPFPMPPFSPVEKRIQHITGGSFMTECMRVEIEEYCLELGKTLQAPVFDSSEATSMTNQTEEHTSITDPDDGCLSHSDSAEDIVTDQTKEDVVGRPVTFGSEFHETGGQGLSAEEMAAVMESDNQSTQEMLDILQATGSDLIASKYNTEESTAIATCGTRGMLKYTAIRLAREEKIIMNGIWALQQQLARKEQDFNDLKVQLKQAEDKRALFMQINASLRSKAAEVEELAEQIVEKENENNSLAAESLGRSNSSSSWRQAVSHDNSTAVGGLGLRWTPDFSVKPGALNSQLQVKNGPASTPLRGPSSVKSAVAKESSTTIEPKPAVSVQLNTRPSDLSVKDGDSNFQPQVSNGSARPSGRSSSVKRLIGMEAQSTMKPESEASIYSTTDTPDALSPGNTEDGIAPDRNTPAESDEESESS
jgi:hypothetical protein